MALWIALALAADAPLTREELVRRVLAAHPDAAMADAELRRARAAVDAVRRGIDPSLELMVAPLSLFDDGHHGAAAGGSAALMQPMPPPGSRSSARAAAAAAADGVAVDAERVRAELAAEAVRMWSELWLAEEGLRALARHEQLVAELGASLDARYAAGELPAEEALEAELVAVELADERLGWVAERDRLRGALEALAGGPLPALPEAFGEPLPVDAAPIRAAADAAVRAADAARVAEARMTRPMWGVSTEYNTMWDAPSHRWMVGVELELPVHAAARRAAVAAAAAELEVARAEREAVDRRLADREAAARARLDEAVQRLALLADRRIPLARQRLEALTSAYHVGRSGVGPALDAARALTAAELDAAAQRVAADLARIDLALIGVAP